MVPQSSPYGYAGNVSPAVHRDVLGSAPTPISSIANLHAGISPWSSLSLSEEWRNWPPLPLGLGSPLLFSSWWHYSNPNWWVVTGAFLAFLYEARVFPTVLCKPCSHLQWVRPAEAPPSPTLTVGKLMGLSAPPATLFCIFSDDSK